MSCSPDIRELMDEDPTLRSGLLASKAELVAAVRKRQADHPQGPAAVKSREEERAGKGDVRSEGTEKEVSDFDSESQNEDSSEGDDIGVDDEEEGSDGGAHVEKFPSKRRLHAPSRSIQQSSASIPSTQGQLVEVIARKGLSCYTSKQLHTVLRTIFGVSCAALSKEALCKELERRASSAAAAAVSSGRPPPRSTEASDEGQAGEEEMPDASAGGKVSP
jgi:hypothetical protein